MFPGHAVLREQPRPSVLVYAPPHSEVVLTAEVEEIIARRYHDDPQWLYSVINDREVLTVDSPGQMPVRANRIIVTVHGRETNLATAMVQFDRVIQAFEVTSTILYTTSDEELDCSAENWGMVDADGDDSDNSLIDDLAEELKGLNTS
ncbi:hypothetical protein FKP32DRAFT_1671558 [Trametes sanguinea]|nr:hypothetical protein FKP32DRAFT_1671558 [Trametes sanguinea]